MKAGGYSTAVFPKWHIGDQPDTRPWARGFDESCGLMYSNDMWEYHPQAADDYRKFPLHFWEKMPAGSRPLVGSSRTSRSGLPSKAAAIPSRCFIPVE